MNTVINPYLFRHRETKSAAFNNLCTVVHQLTEEGSFTGEVGQGERVLGTFSLTCDAKSEAPQLNIDLSTFDTLFRANAPNLPAPGDLTVSKDGYLVFHASGHHDNLYVTLTRVSDEKGALAFDSRRLNKGDTVAFRSFQPGSYTITNQPGGQKAALTVRNADNGKYPDLSRQHPVRVKLSEKGFVPAKIEKWPGQALVISIETPAALNLRNTRLASNGPVSKKSENKKPNRRRKKRQEQN